jgi:hypothetical protein
LSAKGIARGQSRVPVGQAAQLVLRVYIEYADGRKRTQDHFIHRWINHTRIQLPSTARRVVAAIGFRDTDGFGHMVRSAPIQRVRKKPGTSPLKSSRVRWDDEQGLNFAPPEPMATSDVGKLFRRGYNGASFHHLLPPADTVTPALIKRPSTFTAWAQPAQVCLCIAHDFGLPDQRDLQSKIDYVIDVCLPVIAVMRDLEKQERTAKFTLALSPQLLEFLSRPKCVESVAAQLVTRMDEYSKHASCQPLDTLDLERAQSARSLFQVLKGDLIAEYARLCAGARIELVTTMATLAPLTDITIMPDAIRLQARCAMQIFSHHFGFAPQGMVLTGAGYLPSFDGVLADVGLRYAIVDNHAFEGANSPLQFGGLAAVHSPNSGLAYVVSDPLFQHWQPLNTHRSDQWYRDSREAAVLPSADTRWGGSARGLSGEPKARYEYQRGRMAAETQAEAWWYSQRSRLGRAAKKSSRPIFLTGVISATELVGHWFEGPDFLRALATVSEQDSAVEFSTLKSCLDQVPINQSAWLGPALSRRRAPTSLPYFAPRLEYTAHGVRTALESLNTGDKSTVMGERVRCMLSALLCAQASLVRDEASSSQCMRECIEFIERQSQVLRAYSDDGEALQPLAIDMPWTEVFQSIDIQHLTTR